MSITAVPSGGNTTITMTRVVTNAKAQALIADFVNAMYESGWVEYPRDSQGELIEVGSLTDQQKLDMLETYMVQAALFKARQYHIQSAADTARDDALATVDTELGL